MMMHHIIAVALLLAASGGLHAQEPVQKPADEPLLKVEGHLTRDDPLDPVRKEAFHKAYAVKLAAGAYYQIDLMSKDFDAYLRLENGQAKQLAEDDDGGGGQDARIIYRADHSAVYRVIVTTCDPEQAGKYLLTVKAIDATEAKRLKALQEVMAQEQKLRQQARELDEKALQLFTQGNLPKALELLQKVLEIRQRAYPKDRYPQGHPELAISLDALGIVQQRQRHFDKAEQYFRAALAMRLTLYPKAQYPQGTPELARSLSNLGDVMQAQAQYTKAEPFFRDVLAMCERLYPKAKYPHGSAALAGSLNDLGFVLQAQEHYAEAEPLLRRALAMREALYPKTKYPQGHPELAQSLNNLAFLLGRQGAFGKAEEFYRDTLAMNRFLYPMAKYPKGHTEVARSLSNLGSLLQERGEYAKAEPFGREALAMLKMLYPKDQYPQGHPQLAISLHNLGFLMQAQGQYAEAERLIRGALAMHQALFPAVDYPQGHPNLAKNLNTLGGLLRDQGEYARAEPYFRDALAVCRAVYAKGSYPHGHEDLAISLNNVGVVLEDQGELARAEPFFRDALAMREALYPKTKYPHGHHFLALSLNNLGGLIQMQGEYARAERFMRDAMAMYRALYPKARYPQGHPEFATILNNLGVLFYIQGEYAKAESIFREALAMREALYPKEKYPHGHADLAGSLFDLGCCLYAQGKSAKAEPLLYQSVQMYAQAAKQLAQYAPEALALNAAATFPVARDTLLSVAKNLARMDERTYDAIWHSRAALTRVYQRRHLALIAAATDSSIRKGWDNLQMLRRQRAQLILAPAGRDADDRERRLGQLGEQIDKAEQGLLPQLPALKHYEDLDLLGVEALQKRLPADTVLLDLLRYMHLEHDRDKPGTRGEKYTPRYLAFVVSRTHVQRVELGTAAETEPIVRQWREWITTRLPKGNEVVRKAHEAKLATLAAQIRRQLWEPLEPCLPSGTRTVYLAPDGELTQVPWGALPGRGPDRVLLDDYALAVLPHGPFLLEMLTPPPRSAKRLPAPEGFVLVGGIRYDEQPRTALAAEGAAGVVEQKVVWGYLAGTEAERQLLGTLLATSGPKQMANLGGSQATVPRLRQALEHCRYAHVATHGFFADPKFRSVLQVDAKLFKRRMLASGGIGERIGAGARSPLVLSGLVCAGANRPDTPERGILSGDAIAGLLLDDLHLAVLSACDTGIGDVAGGEGVFGLQRAFHIAGCKNIVASLWQVDDAATVALMARFYSHLFTEKLPPIEALRRAQLDLYRHPELIPAWAKGEQRAPGKARPATTPAPVDTPRDWVTSEGRAPIRLWAAFTLSGAGR